MTVNHESIEYRGQTIHFSYKTSESKCIEFEERDLSRFLETIEYIKSDYNVTNDDILLSSDKEVIYLDIWFQLPEQEVQLNRQKALEKAIYDAEEKIAKAIQTLKKAGITNV